MSAPAPAPPALPGHGRRPELVALDEGLVDRAAEFLHRHLDPAIGRDEWQCRLRYPWAAENASYGYALVHEGELVGVLGAYRSRQEVRGRSERFCNLHSWCVHPNYRSESLRLLSEPLRDREHTITTLTVSRDTVEIMRRFGLKPLDEKILLLPNPLLAFGAWRARITNDPRALRATLDDRHRRLLAELGPMRSARATLARQGQRWCLCLSTREQRRGIAATRIIYVSHPAQFADWLPAFIRSFIVNDATPVTLASPRVLARPPRLAFLLREPRPQFFRSSRLAAEDVSCLYSELTR